MGITNEFTDSLYKIAGRELTGHDAMLLSMVWDAHVCAAETNDSLSKSIAYQVGVGSGSFCHSAAAAMLSTGTRHGPIRAARSSLDLTSEQAEQYARSGLKIPGFGNSFFKTSLDPAWEQVNTYIVSYYPEQASRIENVRTGLWNAGKKLYVNAAGLTAATCDALQLPYGVEDGLFVFPRINVWWKTYLTTL